MINQKRVVIDFVSPRINHGELQIKRVVDEVIDVEAHILADGHDVLGATIQFKHEKERSWKESRMQDHQNDEWRGSFQVTKQGTYQYRIQAWVDYALNWQHGIERKIEDGQKVTSELLEGIE